MIKVKFTLLIAVLMLSIQFAQVLSVGNNPAKLGSNPEKTISTGLILTDAWENKISPTLKHSANKLLKQMNLESFSSENFIKENPLIALSNSYNGKILSPVLIQSSNLQSLRSFVNSIGGVIHSEAGNILTAEIPLDKAKDVASLSDVIYLDGSNYRYALMDVSRTDIKADQVHNGVGLPRGFKGNNIIVGVIDSGIDWRHNDFKNAGGTRIQYLWDMSGSGSPPTGYSYGREYTKAQMDANQCSETDADDGGGHGTHVSGTAAGNGLAIGNYTGIAPESQIIFVKGFRTGPGFADADVINGCNYIFNKAAALNKASVINLSLGGHYGPHDGTSLYEQALSNLTGVGKIIVAAAGNEGASFEHLSYTTGGTNLNTAKQSFWMVSEGSSLSAVDMWYNSPGQIYVGIAAYDAQLNLIGNTTALAPGQKIEDVAFTISGTTYGYVTVDASVTADPNNGARRVVFAIDSHNGAVNIRACYWTIYTYGTGTLDAWCFNGGYFTTDSNPSIGLYPGDNNKTIGIPSTALKLLSIGAYVTKTQWTDIDGQTWGQGGNPVLQSRATFSSMGPTRDGRIKPDISAPGEVIVSSLSGFLTIGGNGTPRAHIVQGGRHQKMQGTSMASPHVTGVVALMLERNRGLDYQGVYNLLTVNTKKDSYTGQTQNNNFGFGKLDALKTVQNTPVGTGTDDGEEIVTDYQIMQNYPNPFNPETVISYSLPKTSKVTLKVFDLLGNEIITPIDREQSPGSYSITINGDKLSSGVYFYRITAGDFIATKKMALMK
ncbi:MAG: S8/S53 family peptidase [Ignavibacteriaceae bacterium]